METLSLILISISLIALIKAIFSVFFTANKKSTQNLPPGPLALPFIGNILWLRKSFLDLEPILRSLHAKLGPMVTLHIGPRPAIFIADRSLAHQALVQNGAIFADRPPALATWKVVSSSQRTINTASYGSTWRLLRGNLTSQILHPSRVKSYSHARKWVLEILQSRLGSQAKTGNRVRVLDDFQYAMFSLLVLMCFGDKVNENQIRQVEEVQRQMLLGFSKYSVLNLLPIITRIVLRRHWNEFLQLRKNQEDVLAPLIRARLKSKAEKMSKSNEGKKEHEEVEVISYVDSLADLELPDEKRKLNEGELVSLCSEFLNGGTDTTSTALQWIMANLVKFPEIQEKLFSEIKGVVGEAAKEVTEENLQKMPYLKAIILEGLRRHPPGHFVLPHAVSEDVTLGKYVVPKNGTVNFMIAEMGWDPKVWEDPMTFKPERFLNHGAEEGFDITGSREIKMMPFGAGRRMCPGYMLGMLHLEYFVANLVWKYEWKAMDDVDLSEKQEFTVVMKNPLQAHITPRF